jgi:hypothetical protein
MIGYKLFTIRKDGSLGSLFINKRQRLELNKRYTSKNYPTKGFAVRAGWHICKEPRAPHLSTKGRRWYVVEFSGSITEYKRPESQGGVWYTSRYIKILRAL